MSESLFKLFYRGASEHEISVHGSWDHPLFLGEDVSRFCGCEINAMHKILASWNDSSYAFKMKVFNSNVEGKRQKTQEKWTLTEAGVMKFAFVTQTAIANCLVDWVCKEVLPSIRKTGKYSVSDEDQNNLNETNQILKEKLAETTKTHETSNDEIDELTVKIEETSAALQEKQNLIDQNQEKVFASLEKLEKEQKNVKTLQIEADNLQTFVDDQKKEFENLTWDLMGLKMKELLNNMSMRIRERATEDEVRVIELEMHNFATKLHDAGVIKVETEGADDDDSSENDAQSDTSVDLDRVCTTKVKSALDDFVDWKADDHS